MEISGLPAIVTGAASGLGAATAKALIDAGAKVAMLDINEALLGKTAEQLGGLALACDIASAESVEQALAAARSANGPARILVNCAALLHTGPVLGPDGPMDFEEFMRVLRVDLGGSFNTIRLLAADMSKLDPLDDASRGVIINVASGAAFDGVPGSVPYSAAKGGIVAMTLALAREFGDLAIRVMTISPGAMRTPPIETLPDEVMDEIAMITPFPKRLAEPAEFAELVLAICRCSYLNGETIRLDAAQRMPYKFMFQYARGNTDWNR